MTISSTTVKNSYNGNGSTATFNYTFKIFQDSDLQVIIRSASGSETVKTLNTHYTVSGEGNANGGSVTFTEGNIPTNTQVVVLIRNIPQTQSLDYITNDTFPAESHEEGLDRAMMVVQQLQEEVNRSIKLSKTNTMNSTEFFIDAASRAGKIFGFDDNGELVVSQELGSYAGNWTTATTYSARDIVKDTSNGNIYFCNTGHTSTGSQPISSNVDVSKWDLLVDAASATASATAAASSASAASSSASAASSSASSASASAASAAASYDSFDDRYLGAKASDPTLDNDSNALIDGALYFDTTNNVMKVYDLGNTTWRRTTPTSAEQTSINTVAGISGNVTTVANNINKVNEVYDEINKVIEVANDLQEATSEIEVVANNIADVNTVGANIANVNIAGQNINSVNDFVARYRVSSTQPTTSLDVGDLWYDTANSKLKIYTASGWQIASDYVSSLINVYSYNASSGQTVFTGADVSSNTFSYTAESNVFVFLNGIRIVKDQDYTLSGGNTITLAIAANSGDLVYAEVITKLQLAEEQTLQGYVATTLAYKNTTEGFKNTTEGYKNAAETSATNAANSATASATSATASQTSATASAASAASSLASLNSFNAAYTYSATPPNNPDNGAIWFDTSTTRLKVYVALNNTGWVNVGTYVEGLITNYTYIATQGQTVFTGNDVDNKSLSFNATGNVFVFVNGIRITPTSDYVLSASNTCTLTVAANSGDVIYIEVIQKISLTEEQLLQSYVASALADKNTATTQAGIATTQAGISTTKASEASASAAAALASQNASATSEANALSYRNTTETYKNNAASSASAAAASAALATVGGGSFKISANDTTANVFNEKVIIGNGISKTLNNAGGNETVTLALPFTETVITPTNGQTTFNLNYTVGFIQVFVNGVKLINGVDFTATNGTTIELTTGLLSNDVVDIVKYS